MSAIPEERSRKRQKLNDEDVVQALPVALTARVSPPPLRRRRQEQAESRADKTEISTTVRSPFNLTWIRDLPESSNKDAVTLKDILGDPLISECWEFNYMHNVDFLMSHFDPDVKDLVKVHVVHGFWRDEDVSKHNIKVGFS